MGGGHILRQAVNLCIGLLALAVLVGMYNLARQQRHLVGTQMQVAQQVLIYLLGLYWLQCIVLVAFALMDENTLDDSLVLST